MYKHASRNLQRAHRIDKPKPTGGYIGATAIEQDYIPSAANMSRAEVESERRQLLTELTRAENEIAVAKREGRKQQVEALGHRIQGFVQRLALLKQRRIELDNQRECELIGAAVREICPPELAAAVFDRVNEKRWAQ